MSKMRVPYIDLISQHKEIKENILRAIGEEIDSCDFILGKKVEEFEKSIAQYCGTRYAIGVNSGTDALFFALKACDIGPGDEVITAPNSFISTASVIVAVGAKPVFVDVKNDMNINPGLIEKAVSDRTKAIIPVHLTGKPADMDPINEFARGNDISVIEDAAQAIGAEYKNKKVGSIGNIGCFSLHPLKTLNACGDGGVVTTNSEDVCQTIKELRNLGLKNRGKADIWGYNSRLDSLQAAILLVKMKYLDEWIDQRRKNADFYISNLKGIVNTPIDEKDARSVYHTFVIQAEERDDLQKYLEENGIGSKVHYPIPIHLQKAAQSIGYKKGDFPVCEKQAENILSLPVYQGIRDEDLAYVVENIKGFYK